MAKSKKALETANDPQAFDPNEGNGITVDTSDDDGNGAAPVATAANGESTQELAAAIVDDLDLPEPDVDVALLRKVFFRRKRQDLVTKLNWYLFRTKTEGANEFRDAAGNVLVDNVRAKWTEMCSTLGERGTGETISLRELAAEDAAIEYFAEHNSLVDAGERGLIPQFFGKAVPDLSRRRLGLTREANRKIGDLRSNVAEKMLAKPETFGDRIDRHVARIRAERKAATAARGAVKQAADIVSVSDFSLT